MRALTITPVRPMPPSVASNAPSPPSGEASAPPRARSAAPATATCPPKVPRAPWFLPWMSDAIAPPIVTCCVPGTTGTIQPDGDHGREQFADRHAGADGRDSGLVVERDAADLCRIDDGAVAALGGVAVAAAGATWHHAAPRPAGGVRQHAAQLVSRCADSTGDTDTVRSRRPSRRRMIASAWSPPVRGDRPANQAACVDTDRKQSQPGERGQHQRSVTEDDLIRGFAVAGPQEKRRTERARPRTG